MQETRRQLCQPNACVHLQFFLFLILLAWGCAPSLAMEPPRKGEIARYRAEGTLPKRIEHARRIANDRMAPSLLYTFARRNNLMPKVSAPPPAWQGGLPSSGSPKVLVLLVDFAEYPKSSQNSVSYVNDQMFGAGTAANFPYESLNRFYERSSYGELSIQGNVLGWYRAKHSRSYYENLGTKSGEGQEALIREAIQYYDKRGHDFSQYDNDHDGSIDAVFIKWTGPDTGWSSFWWAYQWSWHANPAMWVDGKRVGRYVWSWIANPQYYAGETQYKPRVDIHETGHLLGLPDYYDYDGSVGPDGGLGGLDMMDANWGDHNAFSKAMLGWLTPQVVSGGQIWKNLSPSGSAANAVLVMPGANGDIFGEFYLAQYRKRGVGNDPSSYPTDGLTVWHVDATLTDDGYDFRYDNSYTDRKLLKLVEADGLEQIENQEAWADAGDFYTAPKSLTPSSTPNSADYAGTPTGVSISGLAASRDTLGARFAISGMPSVYFGASSYAVREGDGNVVLAITRSNATGSASVQYTTKSGSAVADRDFIPKSRTLNFLAGQKTAYIAIGIVADSKRESREAFSVVLINPESMILGTPKGASVMIADDD